MRTSFLVPIHLSVSQEQSFNVLATSTCGHTECAVANVAGLLLDIWSDSPELQRLVSTFLEGSYSEKDEDHGKN